MDIESKTFRMAIKDLDEEGKFRGYLSVFNVVDHGGDLVEPGAFRKTLRQTRAFPLLWAHSAQEPGHVIGTFGAQEDKFGLLVDGEFFMDQPGGQEAHGVVRRLKDRGVKVGLSIGYKADKWKMEEDENERTIRRLKEVQLFEGSMTLFPMNEAALVQAVKDGLEQKPYPNNHACLIDDSLEVVGSQEREHDGKKYTVRIGKKKDGGTADRSYLYPKDTWTEAEARAHCKAHKGKFEPASKEQEIEFRCGNCGETTLVIKNSEPDDKAFDTQEPEKTIPADEPPIEDMTKAIEIAALKRLVGVMKSRQE